MELKERWGETGGQRRGGAKGVGGADGQRKTKIKRGAGSAPAPRGDNDMKEPSWRSHTSLAHLRRHKIILTSPNAHTHTQLQRRHVNKYAASYTCTHTQTGARQQREGKDLDTSLITALPTQTDLLLLLETAKHNKAHTGVGITLTCLLLA